MTGLTELAVLARAEATTEDAAAILPGFVDSPFPPLVHRVADRCLRAAPGDPTRTAVVLASAFGDTTTTDLASRLLVGGQVHNPMLFMQATANAVLGQLAKDHGLTGPLTSIAAADPAGELHRVAALLLADPELDRVLALTAELAANPRATAVHRAHPDLPAPPEHTATALLLARPTTQPGRGVAP